MIKSYGKSTKVKRMEKRRAKEGAKVLENYNKSLMEPKLTKKQKLAKRRAAQEAKRPRRKPQRSILTPD